MPRKVVTPGQLYTLMNEELRKLRPNPCALCRMPLPFPVTRPDDVSANWRIGTPPPCMYGCDAIIAEIAARFWPQYDLLDPVTPPRAPDKD